MARLSFSIEDSFLEKSGVALLFILPVLVSIYYAITLPVSFDEACTFLLFTNKNYEAAFAHYPAPNNHILHSLVTISSSNIPYFSNLFKLRISSIIINAITLFVSYQFVCTHFNKKTALIVVAISSMLFMTIYYSYMSRGYGLNNLFFILTLGCSYNIIKKNSVIKNWILFGLFSVLGFYTMPCFLYPFLTLNGFIFIYNYKNCKQQFISNLIILIFVLLLYTPIIQNEGIEAIINNRFVKPIGILNTLKSLPSFSLNVIEEITGISWFLILPFLLFSLFLIKKRGSKIDYYFSVLVIIAPFILLSLHRIIPFVRVFNYYGFIIVLLFVIPFKERINKLDFKIVVPILLFIQIVLAFNFNRKIREYEDKDLALNITANQIIPKIIGDYKYFFNWSLLASNLEFELISKGYKNYQIKEVYEGNMNSDTISGFDFIIIKKELDKTKHSKVFLSTKYYNIYKDQKQTR